MKQINNAEARLFAESVVWKNHSNAVEREYNNKAKINGDTHLKGLLLEKSELVPKIAITRFKGGDVKNLCERQKAVEAEIETALKAYGMTVKDITFQPTCEKCGDTGKTIAGDCDCFKKYVFQYISSQLSSGGEEVDFASSKEFAKGYPHLYKFYDYAEKYCEKFPEVTKRIFILQGNVGSGKTHLAKGILQELVASGASGLFISAFNMEDAFVAHMLNSTSFTPNQNVNDRYNLIANVDVLVVDDLGVEIIHMEKIKAYYVSLLETRMASGKLTIFTTNLPESAIIERYGERFFSRLTSKSTVVMKADTAVDLRKI